MNLGFLDNKNRLFSYKDEEYDDNNNLSLHLHSTPITSRLFSNSERIKAFQTIKINFLVTSTRSTMTTAIYHFTYIVHL